ncbi:hypothetical protein [Novosphingobium sp. HII-3]|nr:hypothetical protein [Novosphingobium sp. HII-3]
MKKIYRLTTVVAVSLALPAMAQKLRQVGTGVDENSQLPQCTQPLCTQSR